MKDEKICVFCGQKPGIFQDTSISCAGTWQPACKSCEKELKGMEESEICRRALIHGLAENSDRLKKRILFLAEAEAHRPACLRCGGKMIFLREQCLDNTPGYDSILKDPFCVLPAYCETCGKFEIYNPGIVRRNKYLVCLIQKDTQE